jgi:cell division initiation protein
VSDAETERQQLRQDAVKLTHRQNEIAARLRSFLMSELEILAQFQGDDPVGFIKLFPAGAAGALPPAQMPPETSEPEQPQQEAEEAPAEPHAAQVSPVTLSEEPVDEPAPTLEDEHEMAAAWVEDELAPDVVEEPADESPTGAWPAAPESLAETPETDPLSLGGPAVPEPLPEPEHVSEQAPAPEAAPAISEEQPLHQTLADRLRGDSAPAEPSVWQRFRGNSDESSGGGWSLRSLVTGEAEPEKPAAVPADEREKVRKMLEDMD